MPLGSTGVLSRLSDRTRVSPNYCTTPPLVVRAPATNTITVNHHECFPILYTSGIHGLHRGTPPRRSHVVGVSFPDGRACPGRTARNAGAASNPTARHSGSVPRAAPTGSATVDVERPADPSTHPHPHPHGHQHPHPHTHADGTTHSHEHDGPHAHAGDAPLVDAHDGHHH